MSLDSLHCGPHYVHILGPLTTPESTVHLSEADGTPCKALLDQTDTAAQNQWERIRRWINNDAIFTLLLSTRLKATRLENIYDEGDF